MLEINVTGDVKQLARDLGRIRAAVPRITARAINELATYARKQTIDETAKELRLPRKVIAKTQRRGSEVDRFRLSRASAGRAIATLRVISSGIQVTDVAGAWTGRKPGQGGGVKAKGARFYKGAFKAPAPGGKVRVFKRRGSERKPVFLPRIGTRDAMLRTFDQKISGGQGRAVFKQRFERLATLELAKAGIR
jgi:hypothetical protein